MPQPINFSIPPAIPVAKPDPPQSHKVPGGASFQSAFTDAVDKVQTFQNNAQASIDRFLSGEGEELHQVALATQKAQLSFDLFLQVRNKAVAAYEEVMRMQV